jgi:hypothetical protein
VTAISRLTVRVLRLHSGRRNLIVRFRAARAGLVRLGFEQLRRGRFVRLAQAMVRAKRGVNTVYFPRLRIGRRVLGRGSYRIRAVALAASAVNGPGQTAAFAVR